MQIPIPLAPKRASLFHTSILPSVSLNIEIFEIWMSSASKQFNKIKKM